MSVSKRILPTFILLAVLFGGLPETATALPEDNLMLTVQTMGFGGNQLKLGLLGVIAMDLIALATVVTSKSVQGIGSLMYKQQRGMDRATLLVMSTYQKVCAKILETYGEERDLWEEMPTAAQGYDEILRQEDEVRLRQILAMVGLEQLQAKIGSLLYAKDQDVGGIIFAANDYLDLGDKIEIVPGVIFTRAPRGAFSPAGALFQMNPAEFKAAIEGIDPALGTPSWQQLMENWQQAIQQAQAIGEAHLLPTVAQVDGAAQLVNQRIADMDAAEATRLGTALMRYFGLLHESGHAVVQEVIFNSPAGVPFQTLFAQAFAKNPGLFTVRGSTKGAMQEDLQYRRWLGFIETFCDKWALFLLKQSVAHGEEVGIQMDPEAAELVELFADELSPEEGALFEDFIVNHLRRRGGKVFVMDKAWNVLQGVIFQASQIMSG